MDIERIGQSGLRIKYCNKIIYVDPYLSNSVQILDSSDLERLVPLPFNANEVNDADWILITHDHIDHCDPMTIPEVANASPQSKFLGPSSVIEKLISWGISIDRVYLANKSSLLLFDGFEVNTIPAAHPLIEYDGANNLVCVGYFLKTQCEKVYISGDTVVKQSILDRVKKLGPVDTVVLPVNESNFFRERRGIIGNMSVREAFGFAVEVGAKKMIPVHWDMFAENSVSKDEIRLIYKQMNPPFELDF
jgi:L-ascorbate metabolism protein UlaG (beta-lactamase superfamily)